MGERDKLVAVLQNLGFDRSAAVKAARSPAAAADAVRQLHAEAMLSPFPPTASQLAAIKALEHAGKAAEDAAPEHERAEVPAAAVQAVADAVAGLDVLLELPAPRRELITFLRALSVWAVGVEEREVADRFDAAVAALEEITPERDPIHADKAIRRDAAGRVTPEAVAGTRDGFGRRTDF